ncbi:MAG: type II toxin-antitoxin system mRNA interferase toxin, RelE/StbE family [Pseudanabaena sp. 42896M_M3]|jgi:addiction module RelE/StbE family toxin|nr:type II toxin-antitoxin system mRNA interferase toxin, RelE/StbE family [Pseudanabaena sp. 42896M_M3]
MIEITFSPTFQRAFRKRIKGNTDLQTRFWQKIEQFQQDPFQPTLRTHKLSGKMKNTWSFSIEYDARVIFYFTDDGKAVFIDIGTHDEVY